MLVMTLMILMNCLMISCLIVLMESPHVLILGLVIQTVLMVMFIGLMKSLWYSYILFLVFLGGVLIIFVYMSSLIIKPKMDYKYHLHGLIILLSVMIIWLGNINSNINLFKEMEMIGKTENNLIHEMVSSWSCSMYLYTIIYLLLALYSVCIMVKMFEGPLRVYNY